MCEQINYNNFKTKLSEKGFKAFDLDYDISSLDKEKQEMLKKVLHPKMTKYIPHLPYAKQQAFLLLDCREAFYGGSAGGGKSDALLMAALQYVDVPGYSAIIFRKTYADLNKPGALIDRAMNWLKPFLATKEVRWVDKNKQFIFPSGATLQFGYMETPKDRFKYDGGEYQFIGFDELMHFHEICYTYMFSRLRRVKGHEVPLRMRGASNPPDSMEGMWVKTRFIDEGPVNGRIFIPAGMDDNPFLDRESYESALKELDPVSYKRLRDGEWDIQPKGTFFNRGYFEIIDTPPRSRSVVRFWDMAATDPDDPKVKKGNNDPDYTVGFRMSRCGELYFIEDIIRFRKDPHFNIEMQFRTAKADGSSVTIREEEEGGSSGKTLIAQKKRNLFLGYNYQGVKNGNNKIDKAKAFSAACSQGRVKIIRGCRNIEDFLNEAECFPSGGHDDIVDAAAGAFNHLSLNAFTGAMPVEVLAPTNSYWQLDMPKEVDYTEQNNGAFCIDDLISTLSGEASPTEYFQ